MNFSTKLRNLFAFAFIAFVASCTETPPFINYSPDIILSKDTCYVVSTVPAADGKNVLIEDVSGVRCVNCPEAADLAHDIDKNNPGRVVVATLHGTSNANLTTAWGSDTFNTVTAENIYQNLIGGAQGLPTGAVDRKKFDGEPKVSLSPSKWTAYAEQQLLLTSEVNLELTATINKTTRTVSLDTKTTFIEEQSTPTYLSIMILESGIKQPQSRRSGLDNDYIHEDILRYMHTNYSGLLIGNEAAKGLVCEKSFDIEIPDRYVFENVTIAVIVNKVDTENKESLQCDEVHLSE